MVKFSVEALRALMDNSKNIRNFSVVAHVDHGKTTLTDSLLYSNEIISKEDVGVKRKTDTRKDEAARGITIKSTGVSLHYELPEGSTLPPSSNGREFLINLIDSPGHVDFSSEVTAALRLTDGALVLVDCVEGCCVQTETVLRQALAERIKPVLCINKLDRAISELQLEPEEMYQSFSRSIQSVNSVISTFQDESLGEIEVEPSKGTVCFSAGKQGWSFSLIQFARIYSKKLGQDPEHLVEKLWGDNYWDPSIKKWVTTSSGANGTTLQRGFCQFVMTPICQVFKACLEGNKEKVDQLLKITGTQLTQSEKELTGKELLKTFMLTWLPASNAILEMIVTHLPSPAAAQKYRVETLYTGPMDDKTAESIRKCDPNGPLVMYVSKMIPTPDNSRFLAFGRVFSGTVSCQKVRVMGANFVMGGKDDLAINQRIQNIAIIMGGKTESVESVPCGNTCAIFGIDSVLSKSGTIVSEESSFPMINMKYSVSPVVRVAVSCKSPSDLPKLVEGLKRLSKSDQIVQVSIEQTGEHIIACAGDLHLEICIDDLKSFMNGVELVVSTPVIPYQETVTALSSVNPCLAKSPNGHNRLYGHAEPLSLELVNDIVTGNISAKEDIKTRATKLAKDHGWDVTEARKIWAFGPEANPTNLIVDLTKGQQYMNEVRETIVTGFQFVANRGILADETLRGVRFNILDAHLHADTIHRGAGQIIPSTQRLLYASQLTAKPRFLEPVYLAEIQCNDKSISGVYSALSQKRGVVLESIPRIGTSLYNLKAYLPVSESFGFTSFLREMTSGQAFPQLVFDHWELITDDPLEEGSRTNLIAKKTRERKGIEKNIPPLDRFLDRM